MSTPNLDVPEAWERVELEALRGILMVIGAPDTGKSTFAEYVYQRIGASGRRLAFLDGDPGQSRLGPPTTMTLSCNRNGESDFPPKGELWRRCVGSTSPSGHMLPVLVGAARLIYQAFQSGVDTVVYDTSGLVDPSRGSLALKLAKIDLLMPKVIFAIQAETELEPILTPVRLSGRSRVINLRPSSAIQPRHQAARQDYRAGRFASYFSQAKALTLEWRHMAVFPSPKFSLHRLISLEDQQGFTLGLGIILEIDRPRRSVTVLTPLQSLDGVVAINLTDVGLDPNTFRDHIITVI